MIYMKAGNIKGDSGDTFHPDWIPITSVDFAFRVQAQTTPTEDSEASEKPSHDLLKVVKPGDISSPALMQWMLDGEVIEEVQIEVCKELEYPFLRYVLTNVKLVDFAVKVGEEDGAEDTLEMLYEKILVEELSHTADNESYWTNAVELKRL